MFRWFDHDSRLPWVIMALLLAAGWSTSGLIFRHIDDAGAEEIIFYRGLCLTFAITSFLAVRYRGATPRAFRAIGWPGLMGAAGLGLASVAFIMAIERTTIANISFLIASSPFFAGGLAWFVMKEPMSQRTIAATGIAMTGIAVMVWEGFSVGSWAGNLFALACAALSAFYVVGVRLGRGVDMIPTVALAGVIAACAAALMADRLVITWHDFALCALQGIFVSALCNGLFTLCARHLPAGELTMLSMLESVLSPFWVFVFLGETPTGLTIVGGLVVLCAVAFQAFWPRRTLRRPRST